MTEKRAENYTSEDVAHLIAVYKAADGDAERKTAVNSLAVELNKSPASIRAKLVSLGEYVKAERKAKDGSEIVKKDSLVEEIAQMCGESSETFDSLEKANKNVLRVLRDRLAS